MRRAFFPLFAGHNMNTLLIPIYTPQINQNSQTNSRVHAALQYLALTFFYYDYLLTLGDEIAYIWRKRTTPSAYWFLANRYLGVVGNVAVVVMTGVTTVYNVRAGFHLPELFMFTVDAGGVQFRVLIPTRR